MSLAGRTFVFKQDLSNLTTEVIFTTRIEYEEEFPGWPALFVDGFGHEHDTFFASYFSTIGLTITYDREEVQEEVVSERAYDGSYWTEDAYRTITFINEPVSITVNHEELTEAEFLEWLSDFAIESFPYIVQSASLVEVADALRTAFDDPELEMEFPQEFAANIMDLGSRPDTYDANATASDIVQNKTAYVAGEKITGSLVIQHYYTGSSAPTAGTGVDGDIYLKT